MRICARVALRPHAAPLQASKPAPVPPRASTPPLQLVNKLSYRAKQRGFLELDLLVGLWAESALPRMSAAELRDFAAVLDEVRACGG